MTTFKAIWFVIMILGFAVCGWLCIFRTNMLVTGGRKNAKTKFAMPQFPLSGELLRITGVDMTQIDGINVMTAQTLISEIGLDMSRWKTEAHFASWLGNALPNKR